MIMEKKQTKDKTKVWHISRNFKKQIDRNSRTENKNWMDIFNEWLHSTQVRISDWKRWQEKYQVRSMKRQKAEQNKIIQDIYSEKF